jgi:D-alanyl-D-alanine endopeptidase (penicillin-binding protein 7)
MRKLAVIILAFCLGAFAAQPLYAKSSSSKRHVAHAVKKAKPQRVKKVFAPRRVAAHRKVFAPRRVAAHRVMYRPAASDGGLGLHSTAVLVVEQTEGRSLFDKNADQVMSIASITKVMTAMVVLDAQLPLDEEIQITDADVDGFRHSGSRLRVGTVLSRREMLRLALMASENRAASALGRAYPGGMAAFVAAMNAKAAELGMDKSRFVDSTGLRSENVSTANDLVKMVEAGYDYELIREFTTTARYDLDVPGRSRALAFQNTNGLVRNDGWEIGLSKTGYIREAGRCLVMQATIAAKPVIIVLLDSWGKLTRVGDANRIRKWLESNRSSPMS